MENIQIGECVVIADKSLPEHYGKIGRVKRILENRILMDFPSQELEDVFVLKEYVKPVGTQLELPTKERVNHPDYYNNGPKIILTRDYKEGEELNIECIDVIRDMPAWKANIIKYLWRCGSKTEEGLTISEKELEDMKKADWYLDDKIAQVELQNKHKHE